MLDTTVFSETQKRRRKRKKEEERPTSTRTIDIKVVVRGGTRKCNKKTCVLCKFLFQPLLLVGRNQSGARESFCLTSTEARLFIRDRGWRGRKSEGSIAWSKACTSPYMSVADR